MSLLSIAVIIFVIAQFTPKGQVFLASDLGATATVVLAALAILYMLPGLLLGNAASLIFIGLWIYIAYPRVSVAKRYILGLLRKRG